MPRRYCEECKELSMRVQDRIRKRDGAVVRVIYCTNHGCHHVRQHILRPGPVGAQRQLVLGF